MERANERLTQLEFIGLWLLSSDDNDRRALELSSVVRMRRSDAPSGGSDAYLEGVEGVRVSAALSRRAAPLCSGARDRRVGEVQHKASIFEEVATDVDVARARESFRDAALHRLC